MNNKIPLEWLNSSFSTFRVKRKNILFIFSYPAMVAWGAYSSVKFKMTELGHWWIESGLGPYEDYNNSF